MPHGARKRSSSGFYHVVPKGINGQNLFENDADRLLYLQLLLEAKTATSIRIHAYCLMNNHVHLILEEQKHNLCEFIKYVHERYGTSFSKRYEHAGGVFTKTCWSEPIETDEHLLCAVRYVHANPANACICKASAYEWSSAKDYLGRNGITDTEMVLSMCGGTQGFVQFSQPCNVTLKAFESSKLTHHETDDEAREIAKCILGYSPRDLSSKSKSERDEGITLLLERGFSCSRIMRLTGVARRIISACKRG